MSLYDTVIGADRLLTDVNAKHIIENNEFLSSNIEIIEDFKREIVNYIEIFDRQHQLFLRYQRDSRVRAYLNNYHKKVFDFVCIEKGVVKKEQMQWTEFLEAMKPFTREMYSRTLSDCIISGENAGIFTLLDEWTDNVLFKLKELENYIFSNVKRSPDEPVTSTWF